MDKDTYDFALSFAQPIIDKINKLEEEVKRLKEIVEVLQDE